MSLDFDKRQVEKGKIEHSTAQNSIGWSLWWEMNDGRKSIDGMVDHAVAVLTMGKDDDTNQLIIHSVPKKTSTFLFFK